MAGQEAVWHVVVDDNQYGPLTKGQVLEYLRDESLVGSDLIWRPGYPDWKSISEISDFWQPPRRTAARDGPLAAVRTEQSAKTSQPKRKFSLWKSANIGLAASALSMPLRLVTDGGAFADYAHTASSETIAYLVSEIIALPVLFVLIAGICNLVCWKRPKSNANAFWGAITFISLLAVILGGLVVYGEVFFSSNQIISGEFRKKFVAKANSSCVQRERSQPTKDMPDANIEKIEMYCTCLTERWADATTYKQTVDAKGLADLKQRIEAATSSACSSAVR